MRDRKGYVVKVCQIEVEKKSIREASSREHAASDSCGCSHETWEL